MRRPEGAGHQYGVVGLRKENVAVEREGIEPIQ